MQSSNDVAMGNAPPTSTAAAPPSLPSATTGVGDREPKYGGFSRFEIELEFVQSLANPFYLNDLASQKLLGDPAFVAYLAYLQYWTRPPYLKYLTYPGPTLKHLELLQQEKFRQDIISPELAQVLAAEGVRASVEWHKDR
ncbi:mediator of RNA polymerase II transcription subunit 31 [Microdochium nivale]|nr:mediator of RNA polymerase II transcription subunit 31 [Microdochium nivale]